MKYIRLVFIHGRAVSFNCVNLLTTFNKQYKLGKLTMFSEPIDLGGLDVCFNLCELEQNKVASCKQKLHHPISHLHLTPNLFFIFLIVGFKKGYPPTSASQVAWNFHNSFCWWVKLASSERVGRVTPICFFSSVQTVSHLKTGTMFLE